MKPQLLRDQVTRVVERAVLAPSIHNTQPWRFACDGEVIDVWADRRRHLPGIDPTGRQLTISVGAVAEYAALALRSEGFEVVVEVLPDPSAPDLLARLIPVRPLTVDAVTRALVHAMPRRSTYREAFDRRPIPADVLTRLREAVHATGCGTSEITADQQASLVVLLEHAEADELQNPDYRHEITRWRTHESHAEDGVPDTALPSDSRRVSRIPLRRFDVDRQLPRREPKVDDPALVLITTGEDSVADWVTAGRGLARLLLHATAAGLQSSPVTQSLDHDLYRARTGQLFGIVGHPQVLLRLGYGASVAVAGAGAPRRPVRETLSFAART
jgi:hypothetical protein